MNAKDRVSPIGALWRGALAKDMAEAAGLLDAGEAPLAQRIKHARSRLKRSQAVLRLAPKAFREWSLHLRKQLSAIRRDLGTVRDAQALVEAIDDLQPDRGRGDKAIIRSWRTRFLLAQEQAVRDFPAPATTAAAEKLRQAVETVAKAPLGHTVDHEIIARFRTAYRRARKRMPACDNLVDPEDLHRFRKAAVVHRYQLELLLPAASGRRADLEALRSILGKAQDLEMLRLAARQAPNAGRSRDRLLHLIERRQKKRARKALRAARRLFDLKASQAWPKDPMFYTSSSETHTKDVCEASTPADPMPASPLR